MDLGRASRFGSIGAIGIVLISMGTYLLMGRAWSERIAGREEMAVDTVVVIGLAGLAITIWFLFVVIGAYLDRELEARGLDNPDD